MDFSNYNLSYKELREKVRQDIIKNQTCGGYHQRERLLVYGFLRGMPYAALERTINEDKLPLVGMKTFYKYFAYSIYCMLCEYLEIEKSGPSKNPPEYIEIDNWLKERWQKQQEAA